ncbi:hypothetical protein H2200_010798 [Cladophialophora chaetospira]|uniref:Xylanolytic transcriptional activator regulatory domain-containing protein n=1 Tax=Cladophialophora chaetospira TaxID=386627 RepID=A0AA39CDX6_9EURO|nr:hypothetical protein H2200_010798 [Cladophialophora chaetospira]
MADDRGMPKRNKAASRTKGTDFSIPGLTTFQTGETRQHNNDSAPSSSWTQHPRPVFSTQPSYLGIPMSLIVSLVDVYYDNVYNASLLLHKRTFLEALAAGTANQHVVLGVCAFALNFYQDTDEHSILQKHGFSNEWADAAGKLAFQDFEDPTEDHVVTFMNLALYWYSQGAWRRCAIHKGFNYFSVGHMPDILTGLPGNAAQISHLLGLGTEKVGAEDSFALEVRRRRFWACYLMHCHAIHTCFNVGVGDKIGLTLPWPEDDYDVGLPSQPRVSLRSQGSNGGIFCELVKALTFWSEVNALVKSPETSISERLNGIYALDDRISDWWSGLPTPHRMTPESVSSAPRHAFPNLLLVNIVYRQCLCALHASIVPLFCWGSAEASWISARQTSAQIAYDHAGAASKLMEAVLSSLQKLSAIPSFVAYAAYSGCAIQIPFTFSSTEAVRQRAQTNVKANFRLIQALSRYWKFTAILESHVRHIYKIHAKGNLDLENEPKLLDPRKLINLRTKARHARQSILGHNDILWKDDNVMPRSGEDVDLGFEEDINAPAPAARPETRSLDSAIETQIGASLASPPRTESFPRQHQASTPIHTESYQLQLFEQDLPELESLDFFRPFHDPEMLDIFPNGQPLEFSFLQTSPASLDLCDLWSGTARV